MNISKSEANSYAKDTSATFLEMSSLSTDGKILTRTQRPIAELWAGSYAFFRNGDVICARMMSNADSLKCALADGLTNGIGFGSSEFYTFRSNNEKLLAKYLCEFLNLPAVRVAAWGSVTGTGRLRVPSKFYEELSIPLPPLEIQRAIITECQAVDTQEASLKTRIFSCQERIEALFREVEALPTVSRLTLEDKRAFSLAIGKRVLNSELVSGGTIPVFSANVFEPFGYVNGLLHGFEDFSRDSILWGIDGDFMVNFMHKDTPFYPTDHCGVLRAITDKVHPRYLARILESEGRRLGFSRSYRASLDHIGSITVAVPDIEAQTKRMDEVLTLEAEITQGKSELDGFSGMKSAILKKYL